MEKRSKPAVLLAAVSAVAVGLMAGSYGIAAAASGSGSANASDAASSTGQSVSQTRATGSGGAPTGQRAWCGQRPDETPLTGDIAAKVKAAAVAKVGSGATVVRVETDAEGNAAYEAHMVETDGTPVSVYVDKGFEVVSVESR